MKTLMEETTRMTAINSAYESAIQTASLVAENTSTSVANQVKKASIEATKTSLGTLYNGVDELNNGIQDLSQGISKYNTEGIKQISALVNGNLKSMSYRVKELSNLADNYQTFAGSSEKSTTRFILTTDALKTSTSSQSVKETKTTTLWDRIVNLFK